MFFDSLIHAISSNYNAPTEQLCFIDNGATYCILNVTCSLMLVPPGGKSYSAPHLQRALVSLSPTTALYRGVTVHLCIYRFLVHIYMYVFYFSQASYVFFCFMYIYVFMSFISSVSHNSLLSGPSSQCLFCTRV